MSTSGTPLEQKSGQVNAGLFRGNVLALAVSSTIGSLGGFVGVYMSKYLVQIGGNLIAVGLLTSAASLVQFFMLSFGGFLADFYGRRKIIVLSALYAAFFPLFYAVVQDWRLFCVVMLLSSVSAIANPATHAIIADSISPEKRTRGIASLQVVSSLPSVASPLFGGWLIQNYGLENGFRIGCVYAAVFGFLSTVSVFVLLKETFHSKVGRNEGSSIQDAIFGFVKVSSFSQSRSLKALMFSYALVMFSNGAVAQYYIFYASGVAGLTEYEWGLVVSLQLLLATLLKIPGGWLSDRLGKRKVMIVSLLATIPMILLFTLSRSLVQVAVAALLLVAAGIYFAPAFEALQADLAPRDVRGRVSSIWLMIGAVSVAIGAPVGGFAFQTYGPAVPFYLFALAEMLAMLLLIVVVREPERREI